MLALNVSDDFEPENYLLNYSCPRKNSDVSFSYPCHLLRFDYSTTPSKYTSEIDRIR